MKFYRPPNMRQCTKPWENNCTGAPYQYFRMDRWNNKLQTFYCYTHHASLNNHYQHRYHHLYPTLCS